jgi:hypothetical protein
MDNYYWFIIVIAATLGWLLKILEKVVHINETGQPITMVGYLSEDRYRVAISVIGTISLVMILTVMDQMNYAMAIASGYVGESAGRFVKGMANNKMP